MIVNVNSAHTLLVPILSFYEVVLQSKMCLLTPYAQLLITEVLDWH